MDWLYGSIEATIAAYLWPMARIGGMMMVMTTIGSNTTPMRVRLLLVFAMTIAVAPVLPAMPAVPLFSFEAYWILAQQLLIGIAAGFVSLLLLQTFVLAGQIIGMQTSLGFASMVDPTNGQQVPLVGQFYLILTTLLFFLFDGHLTMIRMLVASFETLPVGETSLNVANLRALAEWGGWMFGAALTVAISAIVALLLINFSFGVMTRAAPQLNIFAIGFPITMISGLIILWLTLGGIMSHFENTWNAAQGLLCQLLELPCRIP
ncbi:flagellar biosynthetic protein FliR [Paraferrimonas sedimenticola]|uniref:Flagellar biosynthetic protein FliR n=1 Tax=Paraferrimonas sedimenticola TaxID=375674 RepID=A0AA37W0G1_9GAMM|nr:flagellar biosynthetic protein FliR [Paraferrimonas sedimenticola]GLP94962.1 flagellar biosynthetic protein FliR [Paraferrimonas sedimenticola]